jgi:hypothetical protein
MRHGGTTAFKIVCKREGVKAVGNIEAKNQKADTQEGMVCARHNAVAMRAKIMAEAAGVAKMRIQKKLAKGK